MRKPAVFFIILACLLWCHWNPVGYRAVNASAETTNSVDLPIVMYHSVLKRHQGKYTVSPAQIEKDFSEYKRMGYTPVFMSEVINFVDGHGELPWKPMVITFDDGHFNNMHYVLPLAKKFNFKFVINPITSSCVFAKEKNADSNPNYSYLTLLQLSELEKSGLVEIGSHSHNMHKFSPRYGIKQRSNESREDYIKALAADIQTSRDLYAKNGVKPPTTFAYPFGAYSDTARDTLINLGFRAILTCNEGISRITLGDPSSLHTLKRYNRSGNTTTAAFVKKVFGKLENTAVPK